MPEDDLVSVRYMVDDVEDAIEFYTRHLGNPIELFQPAERTSGT